ncbi:MAG: DUF4203 domain-containing protein [bacterium]
MNVAVGAVALAVGLLLCFFGNRIARFALGLTGFAAGALLCWQVLGAANGMSIVLRYVLAGVAGVLGAVLAFVLYNVGVFLLGALAGAFLAGLFAVVTHVEPGQIGVLGSALVGGIIALVAQRWLLCVLTAFAGAWLAAAGLVNLAGWGGAEPVAQLLRPGGGHGAAMVGIWLLLGSIGSIIQLRQRK